MSDAVPALKRTPEQLREKWTTAEPFSYDMDHEAVGILFAEIDKLRLDLAQHKGNASEVIRLQAKLKTIADLLDEGAYGMATDEARGA